MTVLPPDSPIDLRPLVLYDTYQQKTAESSYENYGTMCEMRGKRAILYDDYKHWFSEYPKESRFTDISQTLKPFYYSDLPIPDIRGCFLTDVINGISAEKSFDDLSKEFENFEINKENHVYWYKQFTKAHEYTCVTFSDLSEDVIKEIVNKCNLRTQRNLRDVSYGLRTIVDQLTPACTEIRIDCRNYCIQLNTISLPFVDSKVLRRFPGNIFEKEVLRDLKFLLNNPKLRLKFFHFASIYSKYQTLPAFLMNLNGIVRNYKTYLFDCLNSLDHKIHVEKCFIYVENEEELIEILKFLKPGALEKLEIESTFWRRSINEVVKMDQWKQAKHLKLDGFSLPSIENLLHFKTIETVYRTISMEDLVHLCNNLSESINFESFTMRTMRTDEILDTGTIKEVLNLQQSDSPHTFLIPDSNLIVEFSLDSGIMKLSKNSE